MGKTLPPLTSSVLVGSTAYRAGDIPPLKHARKITNKRNWEGGVTPDFENGGYEDGVETVDGTGNADAANAGRTGLPGFDSDGTPKRQLVQDTTGGREQLLKRTGGEGAGTDEGAGDQGDQGAGGDDVTGSGGAAPAADVTAPVPPRKATKAAKAAAPPAQ